MASLYPRWQKQVIAQALKTRRVLLLSGPRQCGKTTLARQLFAEETDYRTLDDPVLRELFQTSRPNTCPHGRPAVLRLTHDELLGRFRRR